jgi:predicted phage terminase large subunit-like protein
MLLEEFHKEGNARGLHLPIKGDVRKKPDKFQRIEALEPYFANEKLFFNKAEEDNQSMQTLVSQFQLFQRGARIHDDGPDAVEGAIFIINQRTHQAQPTMYNKYRPTNKHNY